MGSNEAQPIREYLRLDYYDLRAKKRAIEAAQRSGELALPVLAEGLLNTTSIIVQLRAVEVAKSMGEDGLPILKQKKYLELDFLLLQLMTWLMLNIFY